MLRIVVDVSPHFAWNELNIWGDRKKCISRCVLLSKHCAKKKLENNKKNHILENRAKKSTSYEAVEIIEIFFCDADLIQT